MKGRPVDYYFLVTSAPPFPKENVPAHESWRNGIVSNQPPTCVNEYSSSEPIPSSAPEITRQTMFVSKSPDQAFSGSQLPLPSLTESLGRVSSTEGETETDTVVRVVAASVSDPKKSAKKLARMGYPVDASAIVRNSPATSTSKRFGVIRSIVQTIRGKP